MSGQSSGKVKLLYVDDEPHLLEMCRTYFERNGGMAVDTASGAAEALELARRNDYHAIISDYQMDGADGLQLLKDIRSSGDRTPFIIFTGKGGEDVAIRALNLGADFYIRKDSDVQQLYGELEDVLLRQVERYQEERLRSVELDLLKLLGGDGATQTVLDSIVSIAEEHDPSIVCTVMLYDEEENVLRLISGPGLDERYRALLREGFPVGGRHGSCGTAAHTLSLVSVPDIGESPLWQPYPEVLGAVVSSGLRSCWSKPVISADGRLLGTIANYGRAPGPPTEANISVLDWLVRVAAIAIERHSLEDWFAKAYERYKEMLANSNEATVLLDDDARAVYANPKAEELLDDGLEGKDFSMLLEPLYKERLTTIVKALGKGDNADMEAPFLLRSGRALPCKVSLRGDRIEGAEWSVNAVIKDCPSKVQTIDEAWDGIEGPADLEAAMGRMSRLFSAGEDFDVSVDKALAILGKLSGASRTYLFLLNDDGEVMRNSHEWCAQGVEPQKHRLQNERVDEIVWWIDRLEKDGVIEIPDVSEMPPEAERERKILELQGIKSLYVLPVEIAGSVVGFIGFDDVDNVGDRSAADKRLLRVGVGIIGSSVALERAERELRAMMADCEAT